MPAATLVLDEGFQPVFTTTRAAAIFATALQPDGRILVGGDFILAGGQPRPGIARLLQNGSLDTSFNPGAGVDGRVYGIAVQPSDGTSEGKIVIVGKFQRVNNEPRTSIARLHPDGRLDADFNPVIVGPDGWFLGALLMQPDGRIVVGGRFATVGGVARNGIARLLPTGALDASFDPGAGLNGASAYDLEMQGDGRIYVGGNFDKVDDLPRPGVARLKSDGRVDASFTAKLSRGEEPAQVYALTVQPKLGVVVAGYFDEVDMTERQGIARLDFTGALDETFDPTAGVTGNRAAVYDLVTNAEGGLVATGSFENISGVEAANLAGLLPDGTADPDFTAGPNLAPDSYASGNMLTLQPDGKIIVAGQFYGANGAERHCLARLLPSGAPDLEFSSTNAFFEFIGPVNTTAALPGGRLLVGGDFERVNGQWREGLARLQADGSLDAAFDARLNFGAAVNAIAVQPDQRIVIGGSFESVDGAGRTNFTRLKADGSLDETFSPIGADAPVNALAIQPDGRILLGGDFEVVDGERRLCLARVTAAGGLDPDYKPQFSAWLDTPTVFSLALLADGSLLAGGYFHEVNGEERSLVVKLSARGAVNPDFGSDLELEGETAVVTCVVPQADGKVLIGGSFEGINDDPAAGVARLNASGEPDPEFQAGLGVAGGEFPAVESLVRLPDGGLFLGGEFTRFNQGPATNLAMLLGGGGYNFVSTPWGGANSVVFSVSQPATDSLLVGGAFTHIGGAQRLGLARYTVLPDLLISITPDGNRVKLSWDGQATLWEATRPEGPWKVVSGASSPFFTETTATARCFRLREP